MRRRYYKMRGTIRQWDRDERKQKARKIHAVIRDYAGSELGRKTCLDIGCGCGAITHFMGEGFARAVGVDCNQQLLEEAMRNRTNDSVFYLRADAARMPFAAKSFDVIVANQIYEHVSDVEEFLDELRRVMKDDGLCYFAGPNKIQLIEPHLGLPLLHWLPERLADGFSWRTRGEPYDVKLLTYWKLRKTVERRFEIVDYTVSVLKRPDDLNVEERMRLPLAERIPARLLHALVWLSPSLIWILRKRGASTIDCC